MKILLIDAGRESLARQAEMLQAAGHEVLIAVGGLTAFCHLWDGHRPEVVLCDVDLEGKGDGLHLLALLAGRHELRKVRFVAVTADEREDGLAAACGFRSVRKPYTVEDVAEAVAATVTGGG